MKFRVCLKVEERKRKEENIFKNEKVEKVERKSHCLFIPTLPYFFSPSTINQIREGNFF